ncbi:MAG: hypothetical protein IRY92_10665, partial [Dactylosporangium sp.]|nr:hypothetical protein [Dactylosporangium sp.]
MGKIRFSQTGTPANPNAGGDVDLTNGTATLPYTGTKAGQDQWQAQLVVDGSVVGDVDADQVTVTWVAGPAAQLLVTPEGTITRQVGGTARLVATVLDEFGNPVKDQTVTFKLTGTTREGVTPPDPLHSGTSNRNGRVIFDYKDVLVSGTDTITVTVDSLPDTEVQRTVVWEPGPVATIELTFAPNPPTAGADVTVTATLKDQGGNAVPDTEVRLMSVPGSRNTVDLTATTGATGMASLTYTGATDSAEKTDTLWALASGDGGSVIVSDPLQITWTGPAPDSITLSVSKANPTADDTGVKLTATLTA